MTGCADESEFESCWKTMISKYELEEHVWFKRLYDLKEKWCTALNKDFFSAGILTSQRSESTNHAIGFSAKKTTSLVEFYKIFNETIKRWRSNEERDEFQSSTSHPTSVLPITGLMKQAAEVYTKTLFKDFELEFIRCISTSSNIVMVDSYMMVYDAKSAGDEKYQRVVFDIANNLINCSCKKFEECGLLCCHCLRIFHINSIEYIPQHYVMKRWTKFAKSEIWDRRLNRKNEESSHPNDFIWRHEMARKYYALVLKCQGNDEAKRILEDGYNRDSMEINVLMNSHDSAEQCDNTIASGSSNTILNPARSTTKGRKQRIKGHFQREKKKRSTDATSSHPSKEFGSKTPNPHLF